MVVGFAIANGVASLWHAMHSVVSPEGCASILWEDAEKTREAAEALRLTAQDLAKLGVNDQVISEPLGGAHRDRDMTLEAVRSAIADMLAELSQKNRSQLLADRRKKYLKMGMTGLAA